MSAMRHAGEEERIASTRLEVNRINRKTGKYPANIRGILQLLGILGQIIRRSGDLMSCFAAVGRSL